MQETTLQTPPDDSPLEVLHVLLLLQAAMGLLSGAAMLLFMGGDPMAIPLALGVPLLLIVVAAGVVRRWRWARRVAIVAQSLILLAFVISLLLGLLAALNFSVSLMTLITNLVLPISLIKLLRHSKAEVAALPAAEPIEANAANAA